MTHQDMTHQAAEFLLQWGTRGSEPGAFDFPIDIAITPADEIFVTDFYNHRVQQFSPEGELLSLFAVSPNPGGMALDNPCNLYISHFSAMRQDEPKKPDKVTVWSPSGTLLREWGQTGSGPGEFDYPGGITIGPNEHVYVADQANHRIQVFSTQGCFIAQWGEHGIGPGQFGGNISALSRVSGPQFVAVDSTGHIYTTEGSVGRVQKFTAEGEFMLAWGDNGTGPGSFGGSWKPGVSAGLQGPVCIYLDPKDTVWISAASGRIQQFSSDGKYLCGFGQERGNNAGQFLAPHGLAMDSRGDLYVVDSYNHRIQKFHLPSGALP